MVAVVDTPHLVTISNDMTATAAAIVINSSKAFIQWSLQRITATTTTTVTATTTYNNNQNATATKAAIIVIKSLC